MDLDRLREALEPIGREYGCRLIVLFGSAARENAQPQDLDLAVRARGPLDAVAFTNRAIRALQMQAIDVADLCRADPLLMMQVARDGIILYEDRAGEFARFFSLAVRRYADTRKFREMERREIRDFIGAGARNR